MDINKTVAKNTYSLLNGTRQKPNVKLMSLLMDKNIIKILIMQSVFFLSSNKSRVHSDVTRDVSFALCCPSDEQECASDPCQNGGRCVDLMNGYRCVCVDDYNGINCERGNGHFPKLFQLHFRIMLFIRSLPT